MAASLTYEGLLEHLNDQGYTDFVGVHKELKYLAKNLSADELPIAAVRGYHNGDHTVLCTLTPRRILFLDCGMVYRVHSSDVPLKMINGVSHNTGLVFWDLIITNGADNIVVNKVLKKQAMKFINDFNRTLADYDMGLTNRTVNQTSPADELLKYKQLLDQHVITEAEFETQKRKLLDDGHA